MAGASESGEQNFWPGYVDTLVNMVMFLILLIVILSMAVMFFSMKARNDALRSVVPLKDPTKLAANEKVYPGAADEMPKNPTMEDMRHLIDKLKEKLYQSELRYKPSGLNPEVKADMNKQGKGEKLEEATAKMGSQKTGLENFALRPSSMIIRFRPGALDLTDAEAKRMSDVFIKHFNFEPGSTQGFLLTADAAEGLSESNRMAFYRVVAVRNKLIGVAGVSPTKIGQKIQTVSASGATGMEALEVHITKVD